MLLLSYSLDLPLSEIETLSRHHRNILLKIMHLFSRSPAESVYILAGVPPVEAILDIKMFNLLGMIARQGPENPLHKIGSIFSRYTIFYELVFKAKSASNQISDY